MQDNLKKNRTVCELQEICNRGKGVEDMAVKREEMDKIVPKIQFGIMAGYVLLWLLGDIRHLRKTLKTVKQKTKK